MSELIKFRIHFSDGYSMVVAARNPEEARRAAKAFDPALKVTKVKHVREDA